MHVYVYVYVCACACTCREAARGHTPRVRRYRAVQALLFAMEEEEVVAIARYAPRKGAALVFWHGRHPLSPLHEGAPLEVSASSGTTLAPKVVIRTDVLFATEAPQANSNAWTSSNYVAAMLHASRLQADGH